MSSQEMHIDPELLAEFIDESLDMLSGLSSLLVELESADDNEAVQSIFRPIHSIKGNSHFFGFFKVKELSHEMETVLDLIRKDKLAPGADIVDVLLRGVDMLIAMLENGRNGEPETTDEAGFKALLNEVVSKQEGGIGPPAVTPELVEKVARAKKLASEVPEAAKLLDDVASELRRFIGGDKRKDGDEKAQAPAAEGAAGEILEMLSGPDVYPLDDMQSQQAGTLINAMIEESDDEEAKQIARDLLDDYTTFTSTVGFDDLLGDIVTEKVNAWLEKALPAAAPAGKSPEEKAPSDAEKKESAEIDTAKGTAQKAPQKDRTMRVHEEQIDSFLAQAGELLVVADMFEHIETRLRQMEDVDRDLTDNFKQANETFNQLSESLQDNILTIRKVSLKGLLSKMPRIVRDIATANGKQITLNMEGEEVQVDKSLVDLLDAPLVHMIRNAADHGVEDPETRKAAGKDPKGAIELSVTEEDEFIVVRIQDDGAGIDLDAIREKAEAMGLLRPGQPFTEDDLINFIFSSGVSTARKVSDVSGRGVGMDVVKTQIDEAGGKIQVDTERGKGSAFILSLPKGVTTQIIQGFRVEIDGQCFVLPTDRIQETVAVDRGEIHSVPDEGLFVKLHGGVLPVCRLRDELGMTAPETEKDQILLVTLTSRGRRMAAAVDAVLGMQKVVLREIEGLPTTTDIIAGGALLGDGTVALVIDVDQLAL
jgi:two-component system, chemotaxis family, sensor kinase CheA